MKNASLILSILAAVGVAVLVWFDLSENEKEKAGTSSTLVGGSGRIAFVNIDTLEAHYEFLKDKKQEFERKQEGMKAELERSQQQMQNDYAALQRKAQAGTLTREEEESGMKRLQQMSQSLKAREAALTEQLLKEQEEFNAMLQGSLDSFLAEYNKGKNYDYILSYSRSGPIMYANKALDITNDVIKGMNTKKR
jgi:outer membrane protein